MGTADKTIIEEPKAEIKEPQKTVAPLPPVQTKPKPVKTVKPRSSNKKILLFGGIGLIAVVIIYFAVTSYSESDPYDPNGPFFEEDSILIFDEPYTNKNYNIESVLKTATAQPEGQTKRRPGPRIPAQSQLTYAAY